MKMKRKLKGMAALWLSAIMALNAPPLFAQVTAAESGTQSASTTEESGTRSASTTEESGTQSASTTEESGTRSASTTEESGTRSASTTEESGTRSASSIDDADEERVLPGRTGTGEGGRQEISSLKASSYDGEGLDGLREGTDVASVTVGSGEPSNYADFSDAVTDWTSASESATLKLLSDVNTTATIGVSGGTEAAPRILDLNGYGILYSGTGAVSVITVNSDAYLTVEDSSGSEATRYITLNESGRGTAFSTDKPTSGSYVTVSGAFITGGTGGGSATSGGGGGIYNGGNITMTAGTIAGNISPYYGGGIYNDASAIFKMSNVIIQDNQTTSSSHDSGGGIRNDGTFTITGDSKIINNKANRYGGGIYNFKSATFEMSGCRVEGNSSEHGGGIYNSISSIKNENCVIIGNTSTKEGGGIYNSKQGDFKISASIIQDNHSAGDSSSHGGGIYNQGTFTITGDSTVSGNTSKFNGGGVYNSSIGVFNMSDVTIQDNHSNSSGYPGGGIYNQGTFTITGHSTISGNTCNNASGSGVYNYPKAVFNMSGVIIQDNKSTKNGGGICNGGEFTISENSAIIGNISQNYGGGIYNNSQGNFKISDSIIQDNHSTGSSHSGGGIYNQGAFAITGESAIIGNTSVKAGGGIYNDTSSTFEMLDCTVKGNSSTSNMGGGIYNNGTFTISGKSSIIGNKAKSAGGGVCNDSKGTFEIFGCKVQDNSTSGSTGGGIHNSGIFKIADDSLVTGNTADGNGGGVYSSSQFEMLDSRVEDNQSSNGNGGGVCAYNGTFTISGDSSITGNKSSGFGGGVYFHNGTLTIGDDSSITGNKSSDFGGGVYFYGGTLTLSDRPAILNNSSGTDDNVSLSNIYLTNDNTITVKELTGGSVGVRMNSPGVFTRDAGFDNDSEAQAIFSSDANEYMVIADSGKQAELTACYYVEFDVDGGNEVEGKKIKKEEGAVLGTLPTATREGYFFDGWWNREFTEAYDADFAVTEDLTLYAKWIPLYIVTFNTNGHGSAPASQAVVSGNAATKPDDPTAPGYAFMGWYMDKACTEVYDFNSEVNEDITLYAKWEYSGPTEVEIISKNAVSMDKVIIESDYEVTYPSLMPYSFNKAKSKDFYRIFGMTVSSNTGAGVEYAVTKGKLMVVKIKDGDGTYTLDHYIQITGLTPMEKGQLKNNLTKEEKRAAKALAKKLKTATKVDKKTAKTGVGKSTAGIHVEMYPYTLSEGNVSDADNGLKNLVLSGKSGKYQLKYSYVLTGKKGKVKDGKKDAQKDPAVVTYDEGTGLITVSSCEIEGKISVNSDKVTNKTKDIK